MEKSLLLNLELNTSSAQRELEKFKSLHKGMELIDEAKASQAIQGLSKKLQDLKNKVGEKVILDVDADLNFDAAKIKEQIASSFDLSGSMANFNLLQKGLDDLTRSLAGLSKVNAIEINMDSVDLATEKIDELQKKLLGLSTNIGLDLNLPSQNEKQTVVAVSPKNSEDVRRVEQDVHSSVRTSLSDNYIENVKRDTGKANTHASRGKQDTLEKYLKELVNHQKTILDSGAGSEVDYSVIQKLGQVIQKVEKNLVKKGGDVEAVRKQAKESFQLPKGAFNLDELTEANYSFGKINKSVHNFGQSATEVNKKLQEFGDSVGIVMSLLSNLDPTTPMFERDPHFNPRSRGQARGENVALSPRVSKELLQAKDTGKVDKAALETIIHEIRHTQQAATHNRRGLRHNDIITKPANADEAKIVKHVETAYAEKDASIQAIEKDAALFARRISDQVAELLGLEIFEKSPLEALSARAKGVMATVSETVDALENNNDLTKDQIQAYRKVVNEGIDVLGKIKQQTSDYATVSKGSIAEESAKIANFIPDIRRESNGTFSGADSSILKLNDTTLSNLDSLEPPSDSATPSNDDMLRVLGHLEKRDNLEMVSIPVFKEELKKLYQQLDDEQIVKLLYQLANDDEIDLHTGTVAENSKGGIPFPGGNDLFSIERLSGEPTVPLELSGEANLPTDDRILELIKQLDVTGDNFLEIFKLREAVSKEYPDATRQDVDNSLYRLQASDKLDIGTIAEVSDYDTEQLASGIPQPVGGSLFFLSRLEEDAEELDEAINARILASLDAAEAEKELTGSIKERVTANDAAAQAAADISAEFGDFDQEDEGITPYVEPKSDFDPDDYVIHKDKSSQRSDADIARQEETKNRILGNIGRSDDVRTARANARNQEAGGDTARLSPRLDAKLEAQRAEELKYQQKLNAAVKERVLANIEASRATREAAADNRFDKFPEQRLGAPEPARDSSTFGFRNTTPRVDNEGSFGFSGLRPRPSTEESFGFKGLSPRPATDGNFNFQNISEENLEAMRAAEATANAEEELQESIRERVLANIEASRAARAAAEAADDQVAGDDSNLTDRQRERLEQERFINETDRPIPPTPPTPPTPPAPPAGDDGGGGSRPLPTLNRPDPSEVTRRQREEQERDEGLYPDPETLDDIFNELSEIDGIIGRVFSSAQGLFKLLGKNPPLAGLIAVSGLFAKIVTDSVPTILAFQKLQQTIDGLDVGDSSESIQTVRDLAVGLGVDIEDAAGAIANFSASTMDTSLEREATRIFESVSRYGASIGAAPEAMGRAFVALEQIASKGKVSLEELNGQLAEALPGASNIAASSLGVTRREMFAMAEAGDLLATELLPKFATAMSSVADQAAILGDLTIQQELKRLDNAFTLAKADAAKPVIQALTEVLSKFNDKIAESPYLTEMMQAAVVALTIAIASLGVAVLATSVPWAVLGAALAPVLATALPLAAGISAVTAAIIALKIAADGDVIGNIFGDDAGKADKALEKINKMRDSMAQFNEELRIRQGLESKDPNADPKDAGIITPQQRKETADRFDNDKSFGGDFFRAKVTLSQTGADVKGGALNPENRTRDTERFAGKSADFFATPVRLASKTFNFAGDKTGLGLFKKIAKGVDKGVEVHRKVLKKTGAALDISHNLGQTLQKNANRTGDEVVDAARDAKIEAAEEVNKEISYLFDDFNKSVNELEGTTVLREKTAERDQAVFDAAEASDIFDRANLLRSEYSGEGEGKLIQTIVSEIEASGLSDLAKEVSQQTDIDSVQDVLKRNRDDKQENVNRINEDPIFGLLPRIDTSIAQLKDILSDVDATPDQKEAAKLEIAEFQDLRQSLIDNTNSNKELNIAMKTVIENEKAQRARDKEGRDLLEVQAKTAIKQEAVLTGQTDPGLIARNVEKVRLQSLTQQKSSVKNLEQEAEAKFRLLDRQQRATLGRKAGLGTNAFLGKDIQKSATEIEAERAKNPGEVGHIKSTKEDLSSINIGNLSIKQLEEMISGENTNLKDQTKAVIQNIIDAKRERVQVETQAESEVTDIVLGYRQEQIDVEKDKQRGLAEREKQIKNFNDQEADINARLGDAGVSLRENFADMLSGLNREIEQIVLEIKQLDAEKQFKELSNSLKKATGALDSSSIGDLLTDAYQSIMDGAASAADAEIGFEIEEQEIENAFDDGIKDIQSAFDDYIDAFREFQKGLADLQEARMEAAKEFQEKQNELDKKDKELKVDLTTDLTKGVNAFENGDVSNLNAAIANNKGAGEIGATKAAFDAKFTDGKTASETQVAAQKAAEIENKKSTEATKELNKTASEGNNVSEKIAANTQATNEYIAQLGNAGSSGGTDNQLLIQIRDGIYTLCQKFEGSFASISEAQKESNAAIASVKEVASIMASVSQGREQASEAYNAAFSNSDGQRSHDAVEQFIGTNRSFKEEVDRLIQQKAILDSMGIENDIVIPDISKINHLNEHQTVQNSDYGYGISDNRYDDKLTISEQFQSKTRHELERELVSRYGSIFDGKVDESDIRAKAEKHGLDYVAPIDFEARAREQQVKYEMDRGNKLSPNQIVDTFSKPAAALEMMSNHISDVVSETSGTGDEASELSSSMSSLAEITAAAMEQQKVTATEAEAVAQFEGDSTEVKNALSERKDLQQNKVDLQKDLNQLDKEGNIIDTDNAVTKGLREFIRNQEQITKENRELQADEFNGSSIDKYARDLSKDARDLFESIKEKRVDLEDEKANTLLSITKLNEELTKAAAANNAAEVAKIRGYISEARQALPLLTDNIEDTKKLEEQAATRKTNSERVSNVLSEASFEARGKYTDSKDFLETKLNRKGASGFFANRQERELFKANQELERPDRLQSIMADIQAATGLEKDDLELYDLAHDKLTKLEEMEMGNFRANIDNLLNTAKDLGKETFGSLLNLDFFGSDQSIGEQLIGIASNALQKLQDWAANYITDSIFDLLFNGEKASKGEKVTEVRKHLESSAIEVAEQKVQAEDEAADILIEGETAVSEKIQANRNLLKDNAAQLGGAAALAIGGIASGSGQATGAGIGGIIGTLAGAYFGNAQLGGAIGSGLGGAVGGLFAEGTDSVGMAAYSGLTIEEAMRIERQKSGATPVLSVLHEGEAVLSTLNGDAETFRRLKATGSWDMLKANSYAYGTDYVGSSSNVATMSNTRNDNRTSNSSVVNNFNITATDAEVIDRTGQAIMARKNRLGI